MWYEDMPDKDLYELKICWRILNDSILELKNNKKNNKRSSDRIYNSIKDCKDTINNILYLYE